MDPQIWLVVLPFSVVDNSDIPPNRLTVLETLLNLASTGALPAPHCKQRGLYGPSCVRGPACGLFPPLSGTALAS